MLNIICGPIAPLCGSSHEPTRAIIASKHLA